MICSEILLSLLLLAPAGPSRLHDDYVKVRDQVTAQEVRCDELDQRVRRSGETISALLHEGRKKEARELMEETHSVSEQLTRCHRRLATLKSEAQQLRLSLWSAVTEAMEAALATLPGDSLPDEASLTYLMNLQDLLEDVETTTSCPVERYEDVVLPEGFTVEDLEAARDLVADILTDIRLRREEYGETAHRLEREKGTREAMGNFMRELEVMGGTHLTDLAQREPADPERLEMVTRSLEECRGSLALLETMESLWEARLQTLEEGEGSGIPEVPPSGQKVTEDPREKM